MHGLGRQALLLGGARVSRDLALVSKELNTHGSCRVFGLGFFVALSFGHPKKTFCELGLEQPQSDLFKHWMKVQMSFG